MKMRMSTIKNRKLGTAAMGLGRGKKETNGSL